MYSFISVLTSIVIILVSDFVFLIAFYSLNLSCLFLKYLFTKNKI